MRDKVVVVRASPILRLYAAGMLMLAAVPAWAESAASVPPVEASSEPPAEFVTPESGSEAALVLPPAVATELTPLEEKPCIIRDSRGDLLGWADYPHCLVDYRAQSTVRWLDDWFGHPDVDEGARAAIRVITEMVIDDRGRVTPALRVRARLKLPKISKRLSLVFEDESQDGNRERSIPTINESALALRLLVLNLERLLIETDLGVRSGPDLFARARFRKSWSVTSDDQISLRQTVRYGIREKLRAINELDYAHAFSERTVGTLFHNLDHQEEDDEEGLFWSRGMLASHMLTADSTISSGLGQEGVTKPSWEDTARFVWVRYRQRFLRDWLFYEVEPRLTQTRERDWDTLPSLALRLEVHFGQHTAHAGYRDRLKSAQPAPTEKPEQPMP